MVDHPKNPFNDAVQNKEVKQNKGLSQEESLRLNPERKKDNADRRLEPRLIPNGADGRAPRGFKGTKRGLPTPEHQKAKDGFKLTMPGDLKREFKSIARGQSKDRDINR